MNQLFIPRFLLSLILVFTIFSCQESYEKQQQDSVSAKQIEGEEPFFKLSLAQWSLSEPIHSGEMDPMDIAEKAKELGFEGIEYVSTLYSGSIKAAEDPQAGLQSVLDNLKEKSEEFGVRNVLIMVDEEGDLAAANSQERNRAVENHKKWVDAAQFLGCHSIRVNLFGSEDPEEWKNNSVKGLKALSEYAATKNINVLVENHGGHSSNAEMLAQVMEEVALENCGTLPDFGNFCLKREGGERWSAPCIEEYPIYQGVAEMMPYAKAVSAKSFDFNEDGQETTIDYSKMIQIVKDAGYTGFVGVEYEGSELSPKEGILATKNLLLEEGKKLNKVESRN